MLILYRCPPGIGWHPVTHMAMLAVELFQARLQPILHGQAPNFSQKIEAALPRIKGSESCLLICPDPSDLRQLLLVDGWRQRFRHISAWIIDSFWTERIPRFGKYFRVFDEFFVTSEEDVGIWRELTNTPTYCLPWGTDALRLGSLASEREIDILRVGRQPPAWDDDTESERASAKVGLSFHGRPPSCEGYLENQRLLMDLYSKSKFLLAFSNKINPAPYTHPKREYFTARWTDALACGATVAGIAPKTFEANQLLWPGAVLELETIDRQEGLQLLVQAKKSWSPQHAQRNALMALERLDWRWRFATLAQAMNEPSERLSEELRLLQDQLKTHRKKLDSMKEWLEADSLLL